MGLCNLLPQNFAYFQGFRHHAILIKFQYVFLLWDIRNQIEARSATKNIPDQSTNLTGKKTKKSVKKKF